MAETALIVARPPSPPPYPPIGWNGIPDLLAIVRSNGPPPVAQTLILRWLLEHGAAERWIDIPTTAQIAREVGVLRQSANRAWHGLQRRGLLQLKPAEDARGGWRARIKLPKDMQLSLFAGPGRTK